MIQLRNKTEFSLKRAFGLIENVLATNQGAAAGMCDRGGTWGHVQWQNHCKKAGVKPLFGVEIAFVRDMDLREKEKEKEKGKEKRKRKGKPGTNYMAFIAKNPEGLKEIYELVTLSTEKFHYESRLGYEVLTKVSDNIIILSGNSPHWESLPIRDNLYVELSPGSLPNALAMAESMGLKVVATSDNSYCRPGDRNSYEIVAERNANSKATAQHIISEDEWRLCWQDESAIANTYLIAAMCDVELPSAEMVHPEKPIPLRQMCEDAAIPRQIDLNDPIYRARLDRELDLIDQKDFEDYFYVVADICQYAKKHMLVGPARGSSCGSLVCYLLEITEIDPLKYDLLFERFIDINRMDYPDIDIDFPDNRREMVFDYIKQKYGYENVARLGTISRFKAKSAIVAVSRALRIPVWETKDLKDAIIERSGGDARSRFCIIDTFEGLEAGKRALAKFPELRLAADIEGHASNSGQHSAGMIVTANPVSWYCSVDEKTGAAQVDKYDAETLNLLKIDILGLRTLSVIQDTLDQVGWSREKLMRYRTDDKAAFEVLNKEQFGGLFQFEGYALQSLCKQLIVENFEDIASLTALARPGPLISGGATSFLKRRNGESPVEYLHPMAEGITKVTYGVIVYQEQVMQVAREIGGLSWKDVSSLRKAMSKSLGKEFFDQYWDRFKVGAAKHGISEEQAELIWKNINTMGSWAFNRSHAVAYGMMSYWSCVLKAHFPIPFAAACLRNVKGDEQAIKILRELHHEGHKYKAFDRETSELNWSQQGDCLVGGLIGVKGIGPKTAADIIARRADGRELTAHHHKLLDNGTTPYDMVFETRERWGHILDNPSKYNINSYLTTLVEITPESHGDFVFIAKLMEKNLRDHNELVNMEKRGGRFMVGQSLFLDLTVEDDTGPILCAIDRYQYERIGLELVNEARIGDWYLWKGYQRKGFRKVRLKRYIKLTGNPKFDLTLST